MDRRTRAAARAWDQARANDLRELPNALDLVRPGTFGTFPEDTPQDGPKAPTLDHGPLYVGEWREEIAGDYLDVTTATEARPVTLVTLREPWEFVGYAVDTTSLDPGATLQAVGRIVTRAGGRAAIFGTPIPIAPIITSAGPSPLNWLAITGIIAGARLEVVAWLSVAGQGPSKVRANVWGFNARKGP